MSLAGKVILITGGCGDIGAATAVRLASEGARIALLDLPSTEGAAAAIRRRATGPAPAEIAFFAADVTDRAGLEAAFRRVAEAYGRLDVVIANAGIVQNEPFLQVTLEAWKRTLDINLSGAFHTAQIGARIMAAQPPGPNGVRGKILFTGSWVMDMPWPEGAAYISSKGAIKMLAKVAAQELAPLGIRVNVLAPGIVMAGLSKQIHDVNPQFRERVAAAIPLGEMQSAESVADCFAFLSGSASDYMTGTALVVDGGCSVVKR